MAKGVFADMKDQLDAGDTEGAMALARSRYQAGGVPLADLDVPILQEPRRLAASLLFPIPDGDLAWLVERWRRPRKKFADNGQATGPKTSKSSERGIA